MLSTLLAISLAAPLAISDIEDPARLLPADTVIYFGSTSVQASFEASKNTAIAQIFAEPEVRAFLSEPLGAANQVIAAGIGMMQSEIGEAQKAAEQLGLGVDMALDEGKTFLSLDTGAPPPIGQTFVALTHIGMPQPGGSPFPDVGLVIGVQVFEPGVIDMLSMLWSQIPFPDANGSHGGVDYLAKSSPFATVCLATLDDLVVVSTSVEALTGVIDRWSGEGSGGSSLADSSEYRLMLDAAGGLLPGGSSYFVRAAPLASLARQALAIGLPQSGEFTPEQSGKILAVFDSIGFGAIELLGGVSAVGSDGRVFGTTVVSIDEGVPGVLARMARPGAPLDVMLFEQIPSDSLSASGASMGTQLVDMYDFVFDTLHGVEPEAAMQAEQVLTGMLGEYSLRDDLLGNIHGRVITYSVPGQGLMGSPDTVVRLELHNPDAFVGVLKSLLAAVSAQAGMPLSIQDADHEGTPYYRLDLSATPLGMMMQPAFVAADGELVFCSSERQLKTLLNDGSPSGNLWQNEKLRTFANSLAAQGEVSAVAYSNLQASFGTSYQGFAGMAAMIPGLSDLPVDMSKLPAENTIGRHLQESFSGAYRTAEGLDVQRSVSQFQMSDFLPLVLVAGAIYAGQEMGISTEAVAAAIDPVEQVENDLRELKASITVYKISENGYPNSLEDLLRPLADFPNGSYQHDSLPVDAWGQPYRFAMEMHPKKGRLLPKLWSIGPNGVDDSGEGDDILKF